MKELFKLEGHISKRTSLIIEITGFLALILVWWLATKPFVNTQLYFNAMNTENYTFDINGPDNYKYQTKESPVISGLDEGDYEITLTDKNGESVKTILTIDIAKGDTTIQTDISNSDALAFRVDLTTHSSFVDKAIIPSLASVFSSFKELHFKDFLVRNTLISLKLNALGYLEAIVLSLIIGFIIGVIPFFKSLWSRYIDAIRFVPLAAVTGLFIAWFGIYTQMKVQFLAFGIFVFLVPVVVQRIGEVETIYKQTAYTLGASSWQMIRSVYWPHVTSRIIDDIRVLTAISWTYIIVAEMVNTADGGIGAMIFKAQRISRLDKVFALLLVIIIIGFVQDLLFRWIDRKLFPHKYQKQKKH